MKPKKHQAHRTLPLVTLIIAGETVFFLPFLVPRIFRPTMLEVFDITNLQLGGFFAIYGIIAMAAYLLGGPVADRFPARKLMAIALWLTALGGLFVAFLHTPLGLSLVYGWWGFTTIFLFWAALIRATREWGGPGFQGRAFGWLEGGRGLVAALLGTLSWLIFTKLSLDAINVPATNTFLHPFQVVILAVSVLTIIAGILTWYVIPDNRKQLKRDPPKIVIANILKLLRMPTIRSLILIIVCAYSGYKITDDFSLYAREVLGFSEIGAAAVGTGGLWLRALVAVGAGILADRLPKGNLIVGCFALTTAGSILAASGLLEWSGIVALLNMAALAVGIYSMRALYFAILKEAGIPVALTGTAVGLVSFLGYTPEVFMSPWMGALLDHHPGEAGHRLVFLVLAGFGLTGLLAGLFFKKYAGKS